MVEALHILERKTLAIIQILKSIYPEICLLEIWSITWKLAISARLQFHQQRLGIHYFRRWLFMQNTQTSHNATCKESPG